jgi:hypothetical protein
MASVFDDPPHFDLAPDFQDEIRADITNLVLAHSQERIREERERIEHALRSYFRGLIMIPAPDITLENLIALLTPSQREQGGPKL